MATETYQYEQLGPSADSIRLLQLEGPYGFGRVFGTLIDATVESGPYIALSYMWNPSDLYSSVPEETTRPHSTSSSIELDGKTFEVGQNLWNFLHRAHEHYEGSRFWIDAICIDQSNPMERSHQVRQMGRIYSQASLVVIWLGEGTQDTSLFFDYVNDGNLWREVLWTDNSSYSSKWYDEELDVETEISLTKGIQKVLRDQYWSRQWIVQEILLAKTVEIKVGPRRVSWSSLFDPMVVGEIPDRFGGMAGGDRMFRVWKTRDYSHLLARPKSLANLLVFFGDLECSDPRDHVYSLLGLADDADDFIIDYDQEYSELVQYTLSRTVVSDSLWGPLIAHVLGAPARDVLADYPQPFLDKLVPTTQTSEFVRIDFDNSNIAYIRGYVFGTTKLGRTRIYSHGSQTRTIHPCECSLCPGWNKVLPGRADYLIAELPCTDLLVVCRRPRSASYRRKERFQFFACAEEPDNSLSESLSTSGVIPTYISFHPGVRLSRILQDLISTAQISDGPTGSFMRWQMDWRTIFRIWEYASLGNHPANLEFDTVRLRNRWWHNVRFRHRADSIEDRKITTSYERLRRTLSLRSRR